MGGVVEEFIEAAEKQSPSAQYRTRPDGEVLDISTHDQILGGDSGQIYLGCTFPAQDGYRLKIRDAGRRIGARAGAARRRQPLRHRLPGVAQPAGRGLAHHRARDQPARRRHDAPVPRPAVPDGRPAGPGDRPVRVARASAPKHYRATDNLRSERYRGILPEDLFDIVSMNGLHYSHRTESGVLFHMIGAAVGVRQAGTDRHRQRSMTRSRGSTTARCRCSTWRARSDTGRHNQVGT